MTPSCRHAASCSLGVRRAVRLAVPAQAGARRGPRPAHAHHHPARRARRARGGRAGRRSRLGEAARRQGARARRQDAGAAARLILRAQSGDAEPASAVPRPARRRSCMRPRRPIASARISTARTCWKADCPSPAAPTRGWLNRALGGLEAEARVRRDGRRLRGRSGDAAGGARPSAGDVVDAAAASSRRAKTPWRG